VINDQAVTHQIICPVKPIATSRKRGSIIIQIGSNFGRKEKFSADNQLNNNEN
jgi:hypothetical protein